MIIGGACFPAALCSLRRVPAKGNNFSLVFPHAQRHVQDDRTVRRLRQ